MKSCSKCFDEAETSIHSPAAPTNEPVRFPWWLARIVVSGWRHYFSVCWGVREVDNPWFLCYIRVRFLIAITSYAWLSVISWAWGTWKFRVGLTSHFMIYISVGTLKNAIAMNISTISYLFSVSKRQIFAVSFRLIQWFVALVFIYQQCIPHERCISVIVQ